MKTKERLTAELTKAGAPATMIDWAARGNYDDYEGNSATPIGDLVRDCRRYGLDDMARRAMDGEFDGTKEEAEAWFAREGAGLLGEG